MEHTNIAKLKLTLSVSLANQYVYAFLSHYVPFDIPFVG